MAATFIVTISLVVLFISFKLFSRAAGTLSPLKMHTVSYVFYIQIFLLTFVGSVLAACGAIDFHHLIELVTEETKIKGWLGVMYSMIAMPIAMISLNSLFRLDAKKRFQEYINRPVDYREGPLLTVVVLCLFTTISALVLAYTIYNSKSIPFLTLLAGNLGEAAVQRVEVRYSFGGLEYIRNLMGYYMMPIITYYAAIYAFEKGKIVYWFFFIVNLIMSLFLIVFDIQKAPIVFFLFGFIILYTLLRGGISKRALVGYGLAGLFLMAGAYTMTLEKSFVGQITDLGSSLWGRVFISEYAGYLLSLELFPDVITQPTWYIGMPGFILDLFDLENVESARLLMMHINPEGVASGQANLISSYYMAEAWANYGLVGLIVSPIIVGLVVQSVHIFLLKNPKQPLLMAFYSYVTVKWVLSSGFVSFLYLKIILYPLFLYFFFLILIRIIPKKTRTLLPIE